MMQAKNPRIREISDILSIARSHYSSEARHKLHLLDEKEEEEEEEERRRKSQQQQDQEFQLEQEEQQDQQQEPQDFAEFTIRIDQEDDEGASGGAGDLLLKPPSFPSLSSSSSSSSKSNQKENQQQQNPNNRNKNLGAFRKTPNLNNNNSRCPSRGVSRAGAAGGGGKRYSYLDEDEYQSQRSVRRFADVLCEETKKFCGKIDGVLSTAIIGAPSSLTKIEETLGHVTQTEKDGLLFSSMPDGSKPWDSLDGFQMVPAYNHLHPMHMEMKECKRELVPKELTHYFVL